jgi:hypothetical protein
MATQTSTVADETQALYYLPHSCGKYVNNQATNQAKDEPISYLYRERKDGFTKIYS